MSLSIFYFSLGVVLQFPDLAIRFYLINEGLEPAQLGAFIGTLVIPWCLKPVYGLISDYFPIRKQRRKPYIILSNLLCSGIWFLMCFIEDRVALAQLLLFFASITTCFADVMYDSMLVNLAKEELDETHGKIQSWCWGARAIGALLAAAVSGVLLQVVDPPIIFMIQGFLLLIIAFFALILIDERPFKKYGSGCGTQCCDLIQAMRNEKLWKPALFVFIFAGTPSSYSAFFVFLVNELSFSPAFLGLLTCVRHGAMIVGTYLYSKYLRNVPYRKFFLFLILLSAFMGATPVILVTHINARIGVPNGFFAVGDDLFLSVIGQIAMMPCLVLAAKLCPVGIEASLYASFVSVLNFAGIFSEYTGAALTHLFGVTSQDFTYLPHLMITCTLSSLLPLLFYRLLPKGNVQSLVSSSSELREPREDGVELRKREII